MKTEAKEKPTGILNELRKIRDSIDIEINSMSKSELKKYLQAKKGILPKTDAE